MVVDRRPRRPLVRANACVNRHLAKFFRQPVRGASRGPAEIFLRQTPHNNGTVLADFAHRGFPTITSKNQKNGIADVRGRPYRHGNDRDFRE